MAFQRVIVFTSSRTRSPRRMWDWLILNVNALRQHHIPELSVVILCGATAIAQCCESFGNEHQFSFMCAWCAEKRNCHCQNGCFVLGTAHPCFNTCYMRFEDSFIKSVCTWCKSEGTVKFFSCCWSVCHGCKNMAKTYHISINSHYPLILHL